LFNNFFQCKGQASSSGKNKRQSEQRKATATAQCPVEGLHPTLRQRREGWGTRLFVAGEEEQRPQQIPFGRTARTAKAIAIAEQPAGVMASKAEANSWVVFAARYF
jgi:hypothetical protein